jgi:hypothetical protein
MVNPLRGELAFVQDGSTYTLVLDVNALCAAEALLNLKSHEIGASLKEGGHLSALRGALWAGLKRHHDLSVDEAGVLLQRIGVGRAAELMEQALKLAFPDVDPKARPRVAVRGTGSRSTAAG